MGVKRRKLSIKRNKQDVSVQDQTVKKSIEGDACKYEKWRKS